MSTRRHRPTWLAVIVLLGATACMRADNASRIELLGVVLTPSPPPAGLHLLGAQVTLVQRYDAPIEALPI